MIDEHNMAIDAYLRQAGLKPRTTEASKNFIALKPMSGAGFSQVMGDLDASAAPAAADRTTGMAITDYLNQRIPSLRSSLFANSTRFSGHTGLGPAVIDALFQVRSGREDVPDGATAAGTPCGQDEQITGSIRRAARKYNLSPSLIENVIRAESNFQADAVSPAGAQGLMQLMPATARELGVTDAFDISQNIDGGARYLRQMLDRFDGDVKLALAAYNAGPGAVERHGGNVPPYKETQAYVNRILAALTPSAESVA